MARLYTNENFPLPVAEALRRFGHDVLTCQESGKAGQGLPDEEVLRFAANDGRILVTLNRRDFVRLHLANISHAGIIACTYDPNFIDQATRIHERLSAQSQFSGQLIKINRPLSSR